MASVPRDLVERLYAAHPDGFVAARDEAAAAARAAGDAPGAREIARLRKPTVAAWLVNLLALRRPDLMAELIGLAEALRSAQRELRGPRLRELSTRRRELVAALVAQARSLARQAGAGPATGKLPLAEVETTLHAVLADEEVARQVRSGQLIRPASYAGFGEVPRPRLRLLTGGAGTETGDVGAERGPVPERPGTQERPGARERPSTRERPGARERPATPKSADRAAEPDRAEVARRDRAAARERAARRRALDRELAVARREQQRAEAELDRAVEAHREDSAALAELEAALAELERRRAAAESEVSRRKLARKAAERTLVSARRQVGELEAAMEALDAEEGAARKR